MIAPKHKPHPVFFAAAIWNYLAAASAVLIAANARGARALGLKNSPELVRLGTLCRLRRGGSLHHAR